MQIYFKQVLYTLLLFVFSINAYTQVTMGLTEAPVAGALLQLKDKKEITDGSANAIKGLGMPRVILKNVNVLQMGDRIINDSDEDGDQYSKHTGLMVYNSDECLPMGYADLYVWDGVRWQGLSMGQLKTAPSEPSKWGNDVLLHSAKPNPVILNENIYEEFASASFGDAGRWMITNLSAKAYDGITHTAGRQLDGPNGNLGDPFNTCYWAYPKSNAPIVPGEEASPEWSVNKTLGLLYSWDAATAGKGGADGLGSTNDEGTLVHTPIQGICPSGWHLPSDREWSLLEREIIKHTHLYADMEDIQSAGGTNELDLVSENDNTQLHERGTKHGRAMRATCPTPVLGDDPQGKSLPVVRGGFNAMLAGFADKGVTFNYGKVARFWSSSSHDDTRAWARDLTPLHNQVNRYTNLRYSIISVRCIKN